MFVDVRCMRLDMSSVGIRGGLDQLPTLNCAFEKVSIMSFPERRRIEHEKKIEVRENTL